MSVTSILILYHNLHPGFPRRLYLFVSNRNTRKISQVGRDTWSETVLMRRRFLCFVTHEVSQQHTMQTLRQMQGPTYYWQASEFDGFSPKKNPKVNALWDSVRWPATATSLTSIWFINTTFHWNRFQAVSSTKPIGRLGRGKNETKDRTRQLQTKWHYRIKVFRLVTLDCGRFEGT